MTGQYEYQTQESALGYLEKPQEISGPLEFGPSSTAKVTYDPVLPWVRRSNPGAGIRERRWLREHPERLNSFRGMWIAVLGDKIQASGTSPSEVYAFLKSHGLADSLVLKVPTSDSQPYLIA